VIVSEVGVLLVLFLLEPFASQHVSCARLPPPVAGTAAGAASLRPYAHTWTHITDVKEHRRAEDAAITAARSADVLPAATVAPPRTLYRRPVQPPTSLL